MSGTEFKAICQRQGSRWAITVPTVPTVTAHATRLEQAEEAARREIARATGPPAPAVTVHVLPQLDPPAEAALAEVRILQDAAQHAVEQAAQANRRTVALLLASGLPMRDVGTLMQITAQRVQQLSKQQPRRGHQA